MAQVQLNIYFHNMPFENGGELHGHTVTMLLSAQTHGYVIIAMNTYALYKNYHTISSLSGI